MSRNEFLSELRSRLAGLPPEELEDRLSFFGEMIDDRMEDGMTEEEAVAAIGTVDEAVSQTLSEIPLTKLVRERVRPRRTVRVWEIVLIVLGSPIWLSLLIALFAVGLSLYIVMWALALSFYIVDLALALGTVGCLIGAVLYLLRANIPGAGAALGAGLVCAGLAILLFFLCAGFVKGVMRLTDHVILRIKSHFVKEAA